MKLIKEGIKFYYKANDKPNHGKSKSLKNANFRDIS